MVRHLLIVLSAALLGSLIGTACWFVWIDGLSGLQPPRMLLAIASATFFFTFPGTMLLMGIAFGLADQGWGQTEASLFLVALGTIVGAAMLALLGLHSAALGAFFGFLTSVAFVVLISTFGARPEKKEPEA